MNSNSSFFRSLVVGALATLVDVAILTLLVELAHLSPSIANIPALIAGAIVQFIGCRNWVFQASGGNFSQQLAAFFGTEIGALVLNAVVFQVLLLTTPIPYGALRPVGCFLVFIFFCYPAWRAIFQADPPPKKA